MNISVSTDPHEWNTFLLRQQYRPFLQSWAMGEVYRRIGQEPIRLMIRDGDAVRGICFAHVVPARRGRHLSIPYGPVLQDCHGWNFAGGLNALIEELKRMAREHRCSFIRLSPFWTHAAGLDETFAQMGFKKSPLHLLAEHLWYLPLKESDPWSAPHLTPTPTLSPNPGPALEDHLMKNMRSTTRNLIRRAQKEGVTVTASADPLRDIEHFLKLHDETRKRHGFTPYSDTFFRAQVEEFHKTGNVKLYIARHQGEVLATSIHMHMGGETSYHHGASVMSKIPASYLLQWTAICDALKRGDHVYNFWGIAPGQMENEKCPPGQAVRTGKVENAKHPFSGVTLFKTGFGGKLLELTACRDIPLSSTYHVTRTFEQIRKWRRGF